MNPVLIVKNCTREGPGIIEVLLKRFLIPFEIIDLERKENFPPPKDFIALIVLGGPDSANDNNKKIQNDLTRIQEALSSQIPYFGICLGLESISIPGVTKQPRGFGGGQPLDFTQILCFNSGK